MAEKRDRRPRNEEHPELMDDDDLRGSSDEGDDEFEEDDDIEGEDDDLDEDIVDEEASGEDRSFTGEIGSEGGSAGDMELRRPRAGAVRGSEATETGRPSGSFFETRSRSH